MTTKTAKDEPKAMKEIRLIRERLYEQTKDMAPEDRIKIFNKASEEFEKNRKSKSTL